MSEDYEFDGETPVIQVLRGNEYAYSTKEQFPLNEIQKAFKLAQNFPNKLKKTSY